MSIRRALVWTTAERYVGLLLNFVRIVVISRLLTPAEVGIMQLGLIVMMLTETVCDLGIGDYLVQRRELAPADVRTAFTFTALVSAAAAALIFMSAGAIATWYDEPALRDFLRVLAPTFLLGPFTGIPIALLRREMAFGTAAFINVIGWLLNVAAITILAALGFSYMSAVWAAWVSGVGYLVLGLWARPDLRSFQFATRVWRPVLSFTGYIIVPQLLHRIYDFLPSLVLGRLISFQALGVFDRAAKLSELPEKIGTIGVQAVALSAFANELRAGRSLKHAYLNAIENVTAVQWPGFLLLVFVAGPIVQVLLGPQWTMAVDLVRILAVAALANFSLALTGAVLVAAGHVRDTTAIALLVVPIMACLFVIAALHGITAAAASLIPVTLIRAYISNAFVCRRLTISRKEIAAPLLRSLAVSAVAMVAPVVVVALRAFDLNFGIGWALAIGALAVPGWLIGLWITGHAFGLEILRALQHAQGSPITARAVAPFAPLLSRVGTVSRDRRSTAPRE